MTIDPELERLKYPIGQFEYAEGDYLLSVKTWIHEIESLPERLINIVNGLTDEQLDTPYRPGGWTVRKVVHHVCDSHMNGYIRFKWTLTEDGPTIKPYEQNLWAETPENTLFPVRDELMLLQLLHKKWVILLKQIKESEYKRRFMHPESGWMDLQKALALYAWHGDHHLAQIVSLIERRGWNQVRTV